MDASPFSTIPPEIRNEVYKLVLRTAYGVWLDDRGGPLVASRLEPQNRQLLAITKVCRLMRQESLPIFFKQNAITLDWNSKRQELLYALESMRENPPLFGKELSSFQRWTQGIGPMNTSSIRTFTVHFWDLGHGRLDLAIMKRWFETTQKLARLFNAAGLGSRCSLRAHIKIKYLRNIHRPYLGYDACDQYDLFYLGYNFVRLDTCMKDPARASLELTQECRLKKHILETHADHDECFIARNLTLMLKQLRCVYVVAMDAMHGTEQKVREL